MTGRTAEYSYSRYLAAKQGLDDRSLNRQVRQSLVEHLAEIKRPAPLKVLEVGCGIGTGLTRLSDWRLLDNAVYTGIDLDADLIAEARARLSRHTAVEFEAIDLWQFLARERGRNCWDLVVAHAFLDLVDLGAAVPGLLGLLAPGGFFYFTLNFDGATVFEPALDPDLDRLIETLYHRHMDQRRVQGRPSGGSHTGRRLFGELRAAGGTVLAAGSSDWLVFPGPDGYPGDEAYFLDFILHTIQQALEGHAKLPQAGFRDWLARRQAQIQRRELVYLAHQLDFFGKV